MLIKLNNTTSVPETSPKSVPELVDIVRASEKIQIVGAGTKSAMTMPYNVAVKCSLKNIAGIIQHQPSEYLISARGGTTLTEVRSTLASHGQYLPFDPPFEACGATIGGTVAAGLSGAGRLRYGGVRDFIVGVKVVDGLGNVCVGGGNVVKNAAGYDVPKLMVGSAGTLGAIVEVTLKVFPRPASCQTLQLQASGLAEAIEIVTKLSRSAIELSAIDFESSGMMWLRLEGEPSAIESTRVRIARLLAQIRQTLSPTTIDDADSIWRSLADGTFATMEDRFIRVPLAPSQVLAFNESLKEQSVRCRYSVAGNVAWVAWPQTRPVQQLDDLLRHHRLGATVLTGVVPRCRLGIRPSTVMSAKVKSAMDPDNRFVGAT